MNDYYAAEPACITSASDLKHLLEKFGPETGRYLRTYPANWLAEIEKSMQEIGQIAHERYKTIVRRASEKKRLLRGNFPYAENETWVENVVREMNRNEPRINHAISAQRYDYVNVEPYEDIELPPTAEERIEGVESEFARVCERLLKSSHELYFIDPFLNPCKEGIRKVLERLFQVAAQGQIQKITIICRHDQIIGPKRSYLSDVVFNLHSLKERAGFRNEVQIVIELYDDCQAIEKMHPRYLLSIWGAIRLDQGFGRLPKGRRVDVSPVSQAIHTELVKLYHERNNDMTLIERKEV